MSVIKRSRHSLEKNEKVFSPHPGRTAMFCPDLRCLLEVLPADDRLVGIGDNHPPVIRYYDRLPGFVIHNLRLQQNQIAGVDGVAQDRADRGTVPAVGVTVPHRAVLRKTSVALSVLALTVTDV